MIQDTELLRYSVELMRMAVDKEDLHRKLIKHTADLQDFESNLFKLCVVELWHDVTFLKERTLLLRKVTDNSYCDEVYSVVSNGMITFFDCNDTPLIRLVLNDDYADDVEQIL